MKRSMAILFTAMMLASVTSVYAGIAQERPAGEAPMPAASPFQARDYSSLIGMEGFSDTLLNNHFKLYQGYVKNANAIFNKLDTMLTDNKDRTIEYAELERRFGWELDGMLLHEYYFENLGGKGAIDTGSALYKKMIEEFGTFDRWKQDFVSTGSMRGIGWVVLYLEPRTGKLINAWINEHDTGHIAGAKPLLVMDVFEHAYMTDYQLDKAKYIDAFFKNIDWKAAERRFNG